jgi:4'-phosphopantetheinyl transferase EntD
VSGNRSVGLQADVAPRLVALEADAPRAAGATELSARLAALGARLVWRAICDGDEAAFADLSEPLARRRASGAARRAAREALAALGGDANASLARAPGRYPLWPQGFVGSLAHDEALAVALVAPAVRLAAVGVDVEPAAPLPDDVAEIALSAAERRAVAGDLVLGRAIFAAKEAVYKAINPLDGTPLEYEDIEVDLAGGVARLRDGRRLEIAAARGERWIVAAWAP